MQRKLAGLCTSCGVEPARPSGVVGEKCRAKWNPHYKEITKQKRDARRKQVLTILGNKCVRCGFSDPRALQIDHVNGNGSYEYSRYFGKSYDKYLKELLGRLPNDAYQLLCANCNWIKRHENSEFGSGWVSQDS